MTEAGVARRMLGLTCLHQGDLIDALAHLEEAARIYDPERDRDAKFRFGVDTGASATLFLAHTRWQLGEIGRAQELIEEAVVRAVESAHGPTQTNAYHYKALFEIFRGDAAAALSAGRSVVELSRKHGLTVYLALGKLSSSWAHARLGERAMGATELREALAAHTEQGNKLWVPLIQVLLAELEAEGQDAEGASSRIDAALALAVETGERWTDALLHRIRGDILLKVRPDDPAPAEQAFLARHRRCARAGRAQLLPASGAEAGETVPIDRPPRRRPRRACAGARRLLIDSGVTGDRGSTCAARYTGERRSGQGCAWEATGPLTTDFETASFSN